ncbi:DUF2793 domain-containing protein [Sphingomonas segetis]|jgi:hypothetical protein|uniref:DUF2793 domain-containing protein n=1 Tax=Sphingomonas segetis TaxID=1104779 RepID=UPI0012D34966|nr:DUF2793 domain-containing protein [Sphingomonas segetis]
MATTPRLSLPFLSVAQAQKEFAHNESLQTLDVLVAGSVEEGPRATPPTSPVIGSCYLVAEAATGAWAGSSQCVAAWTSGGWRFVSPIDGMSLYDRASGTFALFRNGAWEIGIVRATSVAIGGQQVLGQRAAAVESPVGGTVTDAEARSTINAILDALRQHGLVES